jgi:glycosyltransferase involved in cell wall biosynthesis
MAALSVQFLRRAPWAHLVISNWSLPMGLLAAMVRPRANFRHLLIEHGAGARLLDSMPSPEPIMRTLLAGTDHLHFVSNTIARTFLSAAGELADWGPGRTVHPMPAPRRTGAAVVRLYRPPLRLLFVGRFVPIKGAELLLEALRHVPAAQLTLAGAGPGLLAAQSFAQEVGLTSRVQFLGEVSFGRLPELYAQHDALVLPSRSLVPLMAKTVEAPPHEEGTPRTLLEGMGVGLVPIASASGGMPDLINHGQNGLLFPPGNAAALATEINRLNDHPALCRRLSKEARKTADQWSFDSMFQMWRDNGIDI